MTLYESKKDLQEDVDLLISILGVELPAKISEAVLVVDQHAQDPQPAPGKQKKCYEPAFERFWKLCYPRKHKPRVYEVWVWLSEWAQQNQTTLEELMREHGVPYQSTETSVVERLRWLKEEVTRGARQPVADNG